MRSTGKAAVGGFGAVAESNDLLQRRTLIESKTIFYAVTGCARGVVGTQRTAWISHCTGCITPHAYASTTNWDKSRRARERVVVVYGSLADTVATDVLGNTNDQSPTTKHAPSNRHHNSSGIRCICEGAGRNVEHGKGRNGLVPNVRSVRAELQARVGVGPAEVGAHVDDNRRFQTICTGTRR